ncbi:MAG: putative ABC transporter ATP-binding protein YbhF [Dehalococcoidia bacterium]|nr:putative ABC transporter ATP-binding protein YbhF [Chloroflexota bacterium]MBT9159870.1 putative ABC transporter ATP-binding protein YbhF [Chloroflexota bacterium]
MLEVIDLVKHYGKVRAVDRVSFTVRAGEVFGFLGPNGAGKTTTIKVCTGLLKPTRGQVRVGGFDIVRQPVEAKGSLGYAPDNPFIYEKLTAREFLQFVGAVYLRNEPAGVDGRVGEVLGMIGLSERADELMEGYSFGMKRKVILCAAILHRPRVLLLDEPTAGLDAASARLVKDVFRRLAERGSAVLMTTHIMEIAERLCDRIGIINKGKLVAVGTLAELREQAKSPGSTLEDVFLSLTEKEEESAGNGA